MPIAVVVTSTTMLMTTAVASGFALADAAVGSVSTLATKREEFGLTWAVEEISIFQSCHRYHRKATATTALANIAAGLPAVVVIVATWVILRLP